MSELEQKFNREWGYTMKGGSRTLTLDEHEQLVELRIRETEYLRRITRHTQTIVELARNKDPKITGEEIVVIVFHGIQVTMDVFREIEFAELRRKFHFGTPFSYRPSWLVSVSYAIDLEDKFPDKLHFADDADVTAQVNKIVSPYGFDATNFKD